MTLFKDLTWMRICEYLRINNKSAKFRHSVERNIRAGLIVLFSVVFATFMQLQR